MKKEEVLSELSKVVNFRYLEEHNSHQHLGKIEIWLGENLLLLTGSNIRNTIFYETINKISINKRVIMIRHGDNEVSFEG